MEEKLGFIGAGHMAQALAGGFVTAGMTVPGNVWASAPTNGNLEHMKKDGFNVAHDNVIVVKNCNLVFLAVKPQVAADAINSIKNYITDQHLIISVMAGISLKMLEERLSPATRVIRIMPNTAVLVRNGVTVFAKGRHATQKDVQIVSNLMSSVGLCEEVPEKWIAASCGLAGSGTAYVYLMMQAMTDGGVKMGIPRHLASRLAIQTFAGAAQMAQKCGKHLSVLQEDVTSPGGTTIHGIHQLEIGGLRGTLMNAVEAATRRSDELTKAIIL